MKMGNKYRLVFIVKMMFITFFTVSLFSCSSKQNIVKRDFSEPTYLSLHKIVKNVDTAYNNSFNYLNIKKIDVEIDNGNKKQSFKASLKMECDKFIQVSINAPLGIEVIRIVLTQDSFSMINYHEKYYVSGDYDDFSAAYGIEADYKLLERIFTNRPLIDEIFNENLHSNGNLKLIGNALTGYHLCSEKNINKVIKKGQKKRDKGKSITSVVYSNDIDYNTFKVNVSEITNVNSSILVLYNSFKNFNGIIFPEQLTAVSNYESNYIKVDMNYSKLEFNVPVKPSFKIPAKYSKKEI